MLAVVQHYRKSKQNQIITIIELTKITEGGNHHLAFWWGCWCRWGGWCWWLCWRYSANQSHTVNVTRCRRHKSEPHFRLLLWTSMMTCELYCSGIFWMFHCMAFYCCYILWFSVWIVVCTNTTLGASNPFHWHRISLDVSIRIDNQCSPPPLTPQKLSATFLQLKMCCCCLICSLVHILSQNTPIS